MAITQIISNLPLAPQSTDPTNFRTKADIFVSALNTFEDQLNLAIPQINALETNVNTLEASASSSSYSASASALSAQGSANYQGVWTSKGYTLGQTVSDANGIRWLCKLTHATAQTATEGTYWTIAIPDIGAIGNINIPLLDIPLKNSLAMKSGVGSTTFTRASTATYVDRYGVLKTAAVDTPRFEKEGYLSEGSSTNLLLQSNNMMTSPWSNNVGGLVTQSTDNSTVPFLSDVAIGLNVTKFIASSTPGSLFSRQNQTLTSSTTYTASIFMYVPATYGSTFSFQVDFADTYNGNISTYPTGSWVRAISTVTITTGSTSNFDFNILVDGIAPVVNDTWYCVAPQLESSSKASSYIPTVASAVTRAIDYLNATLMGNSPLGWNNKTILIDFLYTGGTAEQGLFSFDDINYNMLKVEASSYTLSQYYGASPANQTTLTVGTKYRFAYVISGNSSVTNTIKLYSNGILIGSTNAGYVGVNTITTNSAISIGRFGTSTASSSISNFRIYDRALTAYEVALA